MRHLILRLSLAALVALAAAAALAACDRSTDDLFPDDPSGTSLAAPPPADPAARSHETPPTPALSDPQPAAAGAAAEVDMPAAGAPAAARARLDLDVSEHWQEEPPSSSMRAAQWRLLADDGVPPGECVLFHFPGGGDAESNLLRWIGQFEQPDGEPTESRAFRATRDAAGVPVSMVRVTGTYLDQNPPMTGPIVRREDWALVGAVFQTPGDPYFLKCTGPEPVMEAHEGAIAHFIDHFRLRDPQ